MSDQDALWELVVARREGVLATLHADGRSQMSNVLYVVEPESRTIRISTTEPRVKARNLHRDPRAALHVAGDDFWMYAVAEGIATLSEVAESPDGKAVAELFELHSALFGDQIDPSGFASDMIASRRLVIRLAVGRLHGLIARGGRRPIPRPGAG